jgi:hypothetical protein
MLFRRKTSVVVVPPALAAGMPDDSAFRLARDFLELTLAVTAVASQVE